MTKMINECIQMSTLLFPSVEKVELGIGLQTPDLWYVNVVDAYDGDGAVVSTDGATVEIAVQKLHGILRLRSVHLVKALTEHIAREQIP